MATETIRPNSDVLVACSYTGSASHYANVDEAVASDADFNYVTGYGNTEQDTLGLPASAGTGDITNVSLRTRLATDATGANGQERIRPKLVVSSTAYYGTTRGAGTAIAEYTDNWALNPNDSAAWEWADIDALAIGYEIRGDINDAAEDTGGAVYQQYIIVTYLPSTYARSASVSLGLAPSSSRAIATSRSASASMSLVPLSTTRTNQFEYLCVASRSNNSIKTALTTGSAWTDCAKDAGGTLPASHFAQYLNRLCVINYENIGFSYSAVNDITANWTEKASFPNLPQKFTDMFVGRDAGDDPALFFLTPVGMYYLDVFSNFVFGPTELSWEYDSTSGKKGMYWKGDHYVAVGKGIYKISKGVVDLVGPDMDDGLPETLQGTITDMIGVGFWLVIAIDGGTSNKSSILKRYISGKHWHTVYVGSTNTPISALFWDSGTLYFGEGTNVKSLPFSNKTENVAKLSTHTYAASGDLIYPYFHSEFEAMPKTAHKVRAVTQDCDTDETITIHYRVDEDTAWTELGAFASSPRPTALSFPASGDSIGVSFERIQFKASYARGNTTTNSPKLESLTLEYRVVPPVLWGWEFQVQAITSGDHSGQDIISALKTAIETGTLMSFYPDGDKGGTEYFVEVSQMPGAEAGTEFGQEGIYSVSVSEVID